MRYEEALGVFGFGKGSILTQREVNQRYRKLALECHPDKHPEVEERQVATAKFQVLQQACDVLLASLGESPASGAASSDDAETVTVLLPVKKQLKSAVLPVLASYLSWLAEENEQRKRKIADKKNAETGKGKGKGKPKTETKTETKTEAKAETKAEAKAKAKARLTEERELSQAERDIRCLKQDKFKRLVLAVTQDARVVDAIVSLVSYQQTEVAVKLILDITISYIAVIHLEYIRHNKEIGSGMLAEKTQRFLKSMLPLPALSENMLFDHACPHYRSMVGQCLLSLLCQVIFGQGDGARFSAFELIVFFSGAPSFILGSLQEAELTDQHQEAIRKFISEKYVPAKSLIAFYIILAWWDGAREFVAKELARSLSDEVLLQSNWFCAVEVGSRAVVRDAKTKEVDEKLADEILLFEFGEFLDHLRANRSADAHPPVQGDWTGYCYQQFLFYQRTQTYVYNWVALNRNRMTEQQNSILTPYLLDLEDRRRSSKQVFLLITLYDFFSQLNALKLSRPPLNTLEYGVAMLVEQFLKQRVAFVEGSVHLTDFKGDGVSFLALLNQFISIYEASIQPRPFERGVDPSFFQPDKSFPRTSVDPSPRILQAACYFKLLVPVLLVDEYSGCFGDPRLSNKGVKPASLAEMICSYLEQYTASFGQEVSEADKPTAIQLKDERELFLREENRVQTMLVECDACCSGLRRGSLLGKRSIAHLEERVRKLLSQSELVGDILTRSPCASLVLFIYYAPPVNSERRNNKEVAELVFSIFELNCSDPEERAEISRYRNWLVANQALVKKLLLTNGTGSEKKPAEVEWPNRSPEVWRTFLFYLRVLEKFIKIKEHDLGTKLAAAIRQIDAEQHQKDCSVTAKLSMVYKDQQAAWEKERVFLDEELAALTRRQVAFSEQVVSTKERVAGLAARLPDEDKGSRKEINKAIDNMAKEFNDVLSQLKHLESCASGIEFSVAFARKINALLKTVGVDGLSTSELSSLSSGASVWHDLDPEGEVFDDNPWYAMVAHDEARRGYKRGIYAAQERLNYSKAELKQVEKRMNFIDHFLEHLRDKKKLKEEIEDRIASCRRSIEACEPLLEFVEHAERSGDFPTFSQTVSLLKDDENQLDMLAKQFKEILRGSTDSDDLRVLDDFYKCKTCLSEHAKRVHAIADNLGRRFDTDIQELVQSVADVEKRLGNELSAEKILQESTALSAIETDVANFQVRFEGLFSEVSFYELRGLIILDKESTASLHRLQRDLHLFQQLCSTLVTRERLAKLRARQKVVFAPTAETTVPEGNCLQASFSNILSKLQELAAFERDFLESFHRLSDLEKSIQANPDNLKQKPAVQELQTELDAILADIRAIRNRKPFLFKELVKQVLRALAGVGLGEEAKKTIKLALEALDQANSGEPGTSISKENDTCVFQVKIRDRLYAITVLKVSPDLEELFLALENTKFCTTEQSTWSLASRLKEQLKALEKESKTPLGAYRTELSKLVKEILDARNSVAQYELWASKRPKKLDDFVAWYQQGSEHYYNRLSLHAYNLRNMMDDLPSRYGHQEPLCTMHMSRFNAGQIVAALDSLLRSAAAPVAPMPVAHCPPQPYYGLPGFFGPPVVATVPLVPEPEPQPTFGF